MKALLTRCLPAVSFLARIDWLLLVLLAPILLFPEHFAPLMVSAALLALVGLWLIRFGTARELAPKTALNMPILCLLFTVPLSVYASADVATSLPKLTGLLFGIAVFFVAARGGAGARTLPFVLCGWFVSAVAIGMLSLLTTDWNTKYALLNQISSHLPHITTSLTSTPEGGLHPNEVGGVLALFVPAILSVCFAGGYTRNESLAAEAPQRWAQFALHLIDPTQRLGRWVWRISLPCLAGLLILTQSRSALFGTAAALLLIVAVSSRPMRWLIAIGTVAGLLALLAAGPQTLATALFSSEGVLAGSGGSLDLAGREEVWSRALYALQDFPFTGVGLNQFEPVVNTIYPLFLVGADEKFTHAHNLYLQAGVDFGLGGLAAYVAVVTAGLAAAARAYRGLPDAFERRVVLGLGAGLVSHQLFGLTDAIALGAKPAFEWWMFLGIVAGISARLPRARNSTRMNLRLSRRAVFLWWVLMTGIAAAIVGENALTGVGVAVIGGVVVGLGAFITDITNVKAS